MSTVAEALRGGLAGLNEASGNTGVAQDLEARNTQDRNNRLQLAITPLQESLRADQTRLALYANPDDPTKPLPGKETEYNATHDRMAQTIGQMRSLYGQKPGGANPVEAALGNVADKLHITNHLKNLVAQKRADAAANYAAQNQQMATETGAGALPYSMTPGGQAETKKAADAQALEAQRAAAAQAVENTRAQAARDVANTRQTGKVPKGFKAMEQGGLALGIEDQDTGKQYLPAQLGANGDAPPEAKQMWQTIQTAQAAKQAEQAKKDQERDKRLAHELSASNQGTWSVQEDGNGNPVLFNSKTGATQAPPAGLHKSGYYAKQIAPLEAAGLNISNYMQGGVFSGPGDLALQHEFFTATQPSTGFRMTKVQQDTLLHAASLWERMKAKVEHTDTGIMFSDAQRKQIADAALKAIAAKKQSLSGSAGGPKTAAIHRKAQGGWSAPPDAPPAPKQDGKLLKANGQVIAKSQGGQWVQP